MDQTQTVVEGDSLVAAYERFRRADAAIYQRIRSVTGMSDNELRLAQYVLQAHRQGREVKPTEIARHLGISSASTTALLDRLERGGALQRLSHPTDRRSILIAPTDEVEARLSATVEEYGRRLAQLSAQLSDQDRAAVERFLGALADAADSIASA
jgi:DNA-binding MarR family transcriptional regulator